MMKKRRKNILDRGAYAGIATISLFGLLILMLLFSYIIDKGANLLSWDLITGDYYAATYDSYYEGELNQDGYSANREFESDVFYSEKWGIALKDDINFEGKDYVLVVYVSDESPLANLRDKNDEKNYVAISGGQSMVKIIFSNNTVMYSKNGAKAAIELFDNADGIKDMITTTAGSGIRGSLVTTGYLIFFTMIIAMPLGVFTAIYLHEFAPKDKWYINVLRRSVELLTGVPSIIFGLLGAAVFIPLTSTLTKASGGNIISGSLTLAVIVLPVIISSVEESLKVIPDDYRQASFALGANKTQTTFKIILRCSLPGILTATLLSVGRIIGESAALIYAIGTVIKDNIVVTEKSTSLAVFIWSIMAGEVPNFELACAVSLIILIVVLILNMTVKLISYKLTFDRNRG
ncbi:MAG TPA: phosphate ABC transporter permease PstA [Bacillota bacterium]|nr:phosphate ABC transporter permease PstA [Bacillota bacterium]HPF42807.1 phosphate ABC transporter permease PstA [Bacillota bacterium]HPJ86288.1 phosphate ABC transporter permease PstA [Bacillota bacterium]HPQ61561.1 phosphate ABC transporter permease PstA [Bacillota bacterium]HRX91869.1 phosphate ABC transporter permease PstA [Candidatus Izemoplasmatales bacterium]